MSASSFPLMFACALTLYSVVGWVLCVRKLTISSRMVLSGLLLCSAGGFYLVFYHIQIVKAVCEDMCGFTWEFFIYYCEGVVNGH